ncbi:uncharacterized protein [Miscanthus floridulus]|uniref:uncharacterized protein n=1 Tax=Miscanthus floridulus TaxID=154761 RepID=UPI00345A4F13
MRCYPDDTELLPLRTTGRSSQNGPGVREVQLSVGHGARVSVEGLKGCCSCCCGGIWTFLGCFGCCARTCSALMGWCGPRCPLSKKWSLPKKALADFLDSVATVAVMGILSLNIYCATYFVAWAPKGSICISKAFNTWAKVIVVCLPFTLFPLTLYIAGQAKALQNDNLRGLGLVAGAVLLEIVYVLSMGGLMTVCMSARPWLPVVLVTGFLSLLLVTACGCCCYSPKWLRRCLSCICCWGCLCEDIDEEAALEV